MNKRKNRSGPLRNQRPKSIAAEGVYGNGHFMHAVTAQVGNVVRLTTVSGSVWEGIFKTFSPNFDVVLEVAAKVDNPNSANATLQAENYIDKLVFKVGDILSMVAADVDLEYPTKDYFQTDSAISARLNGTGKPEERVLEPWDASSGVNGGDMPLELDAANGWDASEMFKKNEQEYGVQSTYDQSLRGYTVPLQAADTADYREAEAKANQIANEIENQPQHKARLELENGDEETVFAAVVRPAQESNGKYIPPAKRKNQSSGKLVRSTPPPSHSQGSTPSPKSNNQPPNYPPVHQMPPQTHQNSIHPMQVQAPHNQHIQHNAPPPQMGMPPSQSHPPVQVNHNRPHSHTPPHQQQQFAPPVPGGRGPPPVQQGPPPQQKPQINGETKQNHRGSGGPRNVYNSNVPPTQQTYQQVPPPEIKQQDLTGHPPQMVGGGHPRHRDEAVKELHSFAQDFKLGTPAADNQSITAPPIDQPPPQMMQQPPPPTPQVKPPQQSSPPQPQQSISPHQEVIDKVTNTLKKSTLNPNAKEFVFNANAKPFQPRSPSTPSVSRPHTPQTPGGHNSSHSSHSPYIPASVAGGHGGQPPLPVMMPMPYVVASPQYQPQPQGNRLRKLPMRTDVASQMQVAAATGQPLLAPAPLQQFIYPPNLGQTYQPMHPTAVRMYDTPPQIQYMPQNPSQAPSPAQPPPYNPAQGPQAPPQQYQAAPPPQGPHQMPPLMYPMIQQPHIIQNLPYLQQTPHLPIAVHPIHAGQGQPHGPNP